MSQLHFVTALHSRFFEMDDFGGKGHFIEGLQDSSWHELPSPGDVITEKFRSEILEHFRQLHLPAAKPAPADGVIVSTALAANWITRTPE
jgi:hypothetical protein